MIKFINNLKASKLRSTSYQLNKGMTYVELIVVLSIFSVMTSVVLFNYAAFQAKVDIKNLASDIALKIVEAQKSSLSGLLPPSSFSNQIDSLWKPSYGLYFNLKSVIDNKSFIYFTDLGVRDSPQNGLYDFGNSSCSIECLEVMDIKKGNSISDLSVFYQGDTPNTSNPPLNDLTITFTRPNSGANIQSSQIPLPLISPISYVQIKITSPTGVTGIIKLYASGRVQVN